MACSVLIVEDDRRFRDRFSDAVLKAGDLELLGTASTLAESSRLLAELRPDIALIDLNLPDGHGLELIRQACKDGGHTQTLVVTIFDDDDSIISCVKAGASGYLLKDADDDSIVDQIRLLHSGKGWIGPSIARKVLALLSGIKQSGKEEPNNEDRRQVLSDQELAVLRLSTRGFNNAEIGEELGISAHTVGEYVKRIYKKFHVHSRSQAVSEARRSGIVLD